MTLDLKDRKTLEQYSSAFTLSDMEIFVFPELFYSLVLANIMSPEIWKWREDKWFAKIDNLNFNHKVNRIKQYIIDHYVFNLDLETWGLTTKEKEMERFSEFIDIETLKQSNALFGYEGDKYYFTMDIRTHFGLNNFSENVIPYWKTETVEAMNAFKHKDGFAVGAGECVSLSALYAAALFIVGRIPLEDIFLIATPLHSQNFIAQSDGVITNNRRIVTKNMWFNGTLLTDKARRALENEKITIVSHISGYIHTLFPDATIKEEAYQHFSQKLTEYLKADINSAVFINFLRKERRFWNCFQYKVMRNNKPYYIPVETIFKYEHGSSTNFASNAKHLLFSEIDAQEFSLSPFNNMLMLDEIEKSLDNKKNNSYEEFKDIIKLVAQGNRCKEMENMLDIFHSFAFTSPKLPNQNKEFVSNSRLNIAVSMLRDEIIAYIKQMSKTNTTAHLALYALRDMEFIHWHPFLKAAIERNPCIDKFFENTSIEKAYEKINSLNPISIYPDNRLAQPDEVINFNTGDGIEKAITLATYLYKVESFPVEIDIKPYKAILNYQNHIFEFESHKSLKQTIRIDRNNMQCFET